ncbi:MAG: hypothetical protein K0Q50_2372 [Vampirovibrio sp.]|nr:hypothetical protein [Vampirovibrio sp.]
MVINSVTNMPMDGFPKTEVSKSSSVNNQFANALETKPTENSAPTEKSAQNGPAGLSALYDDSPVQPPTFTERAHQAWGFARDVVNNFVNPGQAGSPSETTNEAPLIKGNGPMAITNNADDKPAAGKFLVNQGDGNGTPFKVTTNSSDTKEITLDVNGQYPQKPFTSEEDDKTGNPNKPENTHNGNTPGFTMMSSTEKKSGSVNNNNQPNSWNGDPNNGDPNYYEDTPPLIDPVTGLPIGSPPSTLDTLFYQVDQVGEWVPISGNSGQQPWTQGWQQQPWDTSWQQPSWNSNWQQPWNANWQQSWFPGGDFNYQFPQENYYFPPLPVIPTGGGGGQTWSQGLYGDIINEYFGGIIPPGGSSETAGLEFAPGF